MATEGLRQVTLFLPRDVLEALWKGSQKNVPFQTDELGFPLRIWIVASEPKKKPPRFGSKVKPEPKEDEDD